MSVTPSPCFPLFVRILSLKLASGTTRTVRVAEIFQTGELEKSNPGAFRIFEKWGRRGTVGAPPGGVRGLSVVRCNVAKYVSCRGGTCSVKKNVGCHSVCPLIRTQGKSMWIGASSPDCGQQGKQFCNLHYTDKDGKKQSIGALACGEVSMMA